MLRSEITAKRLLLKQADSIHAVSLYRFWSNPEITSLMNIEPFATLEEVLEMITLLREAAINRRAILYTILTKAEEEIIGSCGFDYIDLENEKAEISFELGENYRSNGFAQEALTALIKYGFEELKLNRIEARSVEINDHSIRLLEKLAFQYEGTFRKNIKIDGNFIDVKMFSILRSEYNKIHYH